MPLGARLLPRSTRQQPPTSPSPGRGERPAQADLHLLPQQPEKVGECGCGAATDRAKEQPPSSTCNPRAWFPGREEGEAGAAPPLIVPRAQDPGEPGALPRTGGGLREASRAGTNLKQNGGGARRGSVQAILTPRPQRSSEGVGRPCRAVCPAATPASGLRFIGHLPSLPGPGLRGAH